MDIGDAVAAFHAAHPRTVFLKTLRRHASVLDVGAGDGVLHVFKKWIHPPREDLRLYAYSMKEEPGFNSYDGFEIGVWPQGKPIFNDLKFDAIFSSHFIEHIDDPLGFIVWQVSRLAQGGRIYCEWPSSHTSELPTVKEFQKRDIPLVISNFKDDHTHNKEIPNRNAIVSKLEESGLVIDQSGFITNPFIEAEGLAHFRANRIDPFLLQSIFWSHTRWAQYVIATKP